MKIYIASDHRGVEVENNIAQYLKQMGMSVERSKIEHTPTDDYVDFAFELANHVVEEDALGILLCGTGIGMSIAANKVKGIRAARCVDVDDAFYAKNHNDANVICLSSSIKLDYLYEIVDTFINTKRASEEKHLNRINKIINYESSAYNEL
ncbi:MAG: RpiB/LacA/LacB family sugar-phosphate isomerase [Firmicutes bacterium]|nr:RpiB/LacA/LacB family sugar-phosphate isomerase [Bacillota bacterium]